MLKLTQNGSTLTACLSGEIDHHTAADIRLGIDTKVRLASPSTLVLDFSGVTFMDSSGVGIVIGRYKLMRLLGGKLVVTNIPEQIRRVFALSGLANLGIFS